MLLPQYKSCYKLNRLDKTALSAHNEPRIVVFDWKQMILETDTLGKGAHKMTLLCVRQLTI